MAISFPRFNALNLGQVAANQEAVRGARIRNSILGMQEQDQRRQGQQRERIRQIRSMTDNAGEAIQLLEQAGQFDEADQLRASVRQQFNSTIGVLESMKGWVDAENYKDVRAMLLQEGVIDPEDMPTEYSGSFFDRQIAGVKNKLSKIETRAPGAEPGQVMVTDRLFDEFGREIETGQPYEDPTSRRNRLGGGAGGAGGKWKFTASDTNAIGRAIGDFMGATYSPITGTFSGLNRDQAEQAQTIREEASRLYLEGQGQLTHDQAVAAAVRQFGVGLRNLQDERMNDPLGIRNSLQPGP